MKKIGTATLTFMLGIMVSFVMNIAAETMLSSQSVSYSNNKTEETTVNGALDELFSAVDINERLGNTESLSNVSDGTVAGILNELYSTRSHVGMVIQSTTLDTMEKVKAMYGGTTWTKIEGKFLLGQSSSYAINSTGGSATNTLTTANLPSHTHIVGAHSHGLNKHTHSIPSLSGTTASAGSHNHGIYTLDYAMMGGSQSNRRAIVSGSERSDWATNATGEHTHSVTTNASTTGAASGSTANSSAFNSGATGSGTAVNNMPPYKAVYIWERTA